MKIITILFMMAWCLLGMIQIINPTPATIFLDIIMIIFQFYMLDRTNEGWDRSLKGWRETINYNKKIYESKIKGESYKK